MSISRNCRWRGAVAGIGAAIGLGACAAPLPGDAPSTRLEGSSGTPEVGLSEPSDSEEWILQGTKGARAGTLVRPRGPGPYPAVLLVGRTGGRERDRVERGFPTFRRLAEALAKAGIASLRLDDHGVGTVDRAFEVTTFDRLEDARLAVARLREDPSIAPDRVGVVGHDEGALVATWAAVYDEGLAFVVLLAPTTLPVEDAYHARLDARPGGADVDEHRRLDLLFAAVRSGQDVAAAARATGFATELSPIAATDWFRVYIGLDPTPLFGRSRFPTLAVFAGLDRRDPAAVHAAALERALDRAGRHDVVVTTLDGADHDFLPAGAVAPVTTFAPGFLDTVTGWIAAQ